VIARVLIVALLLASPLLAACGGGGRSTLPPAPGTDGTIALARLRHDPEVYADATVRTIGTVVRTRIRRQRLFALAGGGPGTRIVLEPTARFRALVGRRVRVDGIFTVSFAIGYEVLASRVTPVGSL
jgi:hypothetical protein